MTRRSVLFALLVFGPLAACESKDDMQPGDVNDTVDPAVEEKRLRRPPPATSRMGSDPDNPNGAPGSSRLGTSSTRY